MVRQKEYPLGPKCLSLFSWLHLIQLLDCLRTLNGIKASVVLWKMKLFDICGCLFFLATRLPTYPLRDQAFRSSFYMWNAGIVSLLKGKHSNQVGTHSPSQSYAPASTTHKIGKEFCTQSLAVLALVTRGVVFDFMFSFISLFVEETLPFILFLLLSIFRFMQIERCQGKKNLYSSGLQLVKP